MPFAKISNQFAKISNGFAKISNQFAKISNQFAKISNRFDPFWMQGVHSVRSGLGAIFFDGVCLGLIGIWWSGGVSYHSHLYLKHGADPRRAAIIWALLGYGCFKDLRKTSLVLRAAKQLGAVLSTPRFRWSVYLICCLGAVQLAVAQVLAMRVTLWDVGIFHQILWSLSHGLGFNSTISGAGDFLGDHFVPSLALLVPLFQFFGESPKFLPVAQVLLIFGGGAAWIFLAERTERGESWKSWESGESGERSDVLTNHCRKSEILGPRPPSFRHSFHLLRKAAKAISQRNQWTAPHLRTDGTLAAATTVFILGFDSLWKNLRWGFHENAMAFCSVSWALALLFSSALSGRPLLKRVFIVVLFLIAAGSKEILLLDVAAGFCVWAAFDLISVREQTDPAAHSKRVPSFIFSTFMFPTRTSPGFVFPIFKIFLAIALTAGFIFFEKMAHPPDKNYFNRYYAYLGGNLDEFLKNLLVAPGLIFDNIGLKALMQYFWVVFFPWLFLIPAFVKVGGRKANLSRFSEIPWLFMILPSFASAALASFPPLRDPAFHYVLELWPVLACVTIKVLARHKSSTLNWGWALMSLIALDFDSVAEYREYQSQGRERAEIIKLIERIPPEAAVMADELAGTWISGRRWVTRWPDTRLLPLTCPDYVLIEDQRNQREKEVRELISRCEGKVSGAGISVPLGSVQRAGSWSLFRTHRNS